MNKSSNTLYKALQAFPRKRITLEALNKLCSNPEQLSEQIIELNDKGILVPVKSSGTNGNQKNPLFMRYTICIENTMQVSPNEIYGLHPRISANGYLLRNQMEYVNNKAFLCRLSELFIRTAFPFLIIATGLCGFRRFQHSCYLKITVYIIITQEWLFCNHSCERCSNFKT